MEILRSVIALVFIPMMNHLAIDKRATKRLLGHATMLCNADSVDILVNVSVGDAQAASPTRMLLALEAEGWLRSRTLAATLGQTCTKQIAARVDDVSAFAATPPKRISVSRPGSLDNHQACELMTDEIERSGAAHFDSPLSKRAISRSM